MTGRCVCTEEQNASLQAVWLTSSLHSAALHQTPGNPTAKLQCQPSSIVGSTAGVRRGVVVRWVPLRAKASVWACAAVHCSWPKDRLGGLVVNICSRDCTICPRPSGAGQGGGDRTSLVSHQKQCNQRQKATGLAVFYLRSWEVQINQILAHLE